MTDDQFRKKYYGDSRFWMAYYIISKHAVSKVKDKKQKCIRELQEELGVSEIQTKYLEAITIGDLVNLDKNLENLPTDQELRRL